MNLHPNWSTLATVDFRWKRFVTSTIESKPNHTTNFRQNNCDNLTGDKAQHIYSSIVELDKQSDLPLNNSNSHSGSNSYESKCNRQIEIGLKNKRNVLSEADTNKLMTEIMKEAEKNDVNKVSTLIEGLPNINSVDKYGWTILMSAACAGAREVVDFLIKYGADIYVKDKSGNTCLSLARRHRHKEVVSIIESSRSIVNESNKTCPVDIEEIVVNKDFYCEVCKQKLTNTTKVKHETSTVHLFNRKPQLCPTVYGIPESNKGFQILLKGGWDKEKGLGPDGCGLKFPLKTVLKRDRQGLGKCKETARVTHFPAFDKSAVRVESARKITKRQQDAYLRKQKIKERTFRREFY